MHRHIFKIITIIFAATIIKPVFAFTTKNCSFPHHFAIVGPKGTKIAKVQIDTYPQNNLAIANATSNSFDSVLINGNNCTGGVISLRVGTDGVHWADIILLDFESKMSINYITETNRFNLKEIDASNKPYYQVIFVQN